MRRFLYIWLNKAFWYLEWRHGNWPFEKGWKRGRYCCPIDFICTKIHKLMEALDYENPKTTS